MKYVHLGVCLCPEACVLCLYELVLVSSFYTFTTFGTTKSEDPSVVGPRFSCKTKTWILWECIMSSRVLISKEVNVCMCSVFYVSFAFTY